MEVASEEAQEEKKKVTGCVHPYVLQWSGRCEGCRKAPLSPKLPDHYVRVRHDDEDAA